MKGLFPGLLIAAMALFGLTGCSTSDCRSYCNRYQTCIEDDISVDSCTDRCEAASAENTDHEEKVAECATCVESRTCAESFDECVDDCFGVSGP